MASILAIEDDEIVGAILERVLGHAGHSVHLARRLEAGRGALKNERFDLILLDLNLPDGTGMEFLRVFRQELRGSIPVVVLSGMRQEDSVVQGFALGADDYITKPFSPAELVARVDRWTRR